MEYASDIWGGSSKSSLSILDRVQRKAIRLVGDQKLTERLQSLEHRRRVSALSLFHRYLVGQCSVEIQSLLPPFVVTQRTARPSQAQHGFCVLIPNTRTTTHTTSYIVRVSKLWNQLPKSVFDDRQFRNLSHFKKTIDKLKLESFLA